MHVALSSLLVLALCQQARFTDLSAAQRIHDLTVGRVKEIFGRRSLASAIRACGLSLVNADTWTWNAVTHWCNLWILTMLQQPSHCVESTNSKVPLLLFRLCLLANVNQRTASVQGIVSNLGCVVAFESREVQLFFGRPMNWGNPVRCLSSRHQWFCTSIPAWLP